MTKQHESETTIFKVRLWLAEHFGFYRYEGCWSMSNMPKARVRYSDGISSYMAIGNAVDYAKIFGGKVIP